MAYEPVNATASTYEADQREVVDATDTVEGRLSGLLSSDSDYMEIAKNQGLQTAQSRGLLNSSMASEASQAAAIKASLPIAQQDAATYSDTRMQNQDSNNQAMQYNAGLLTDMSQFNADAENAYNLNQAEYTWRSGENEADRSLTEWQVGTEQEGAMDRLQVSETGSTERNAADNAAALERTQLGEAGATERAEMTNTTSITLEGMQQEGQTSRQILQNDANMALQIVSDSSAMERQIQSDMGAFDRLVEQGELDLGLQTLRENSDTMRTMLQIDSNEAITAADNLVKQYIQDTSIAQSDRAYFATSYGDLTENHTDYIYSIKIDSELSPDEKNRLIVEADTDYLEDTKMMGTVFGIPIEIG